MRPGSVIPIYVAGSTLTAVAAISMGIGLVTGRGRVQRPGRWWWALGALLLVGIGMLRRSRPSGG